MNNASRFDRWFLLIDDKFHAWGHLRQVLSTSQHLWKLQGSAHEILVRHLAEWVGGLTEQSGNIQDGHLLRDVEELVVLLLLLDILRPREEHLDVLVEVSVLEELAVVLQETDQLLPAFFRTLGQLKETLCVHLGHMFMCLISTWWSWAPQLGLQLGPFQSPVNISSEEEDLTEEEKWIWKS